MLMKARKEFTLWQNFGRGHLLRLPRSKPSEVLLLLTDLVKDMLLYSKSGSTTKEALEQLST